MFLIFCLIIGIYVVFILYLAVAWIGKKSYEPTNDSVGVTVSLVICSRNEQGNLPNLLSTIEPQINDIDQIILASDHSTDDTLSLLKSFGRKYANVVVFASDGEGKKATFKEALSQTTTDYVLCSDADVLLPIGYFRLVKDFLTNFRPKIMIGGVKYASSQTFFGKLEALEFSSLAVSGAGMALSGCPTMCNGANMAFDKNIWSDAQHYLVETQQSGDDVFLLHYAKKKQYKIAFLKHKNAFVETFATENIKKFFEQRKRWASKSTSYYDWQTIGVALLVLIVNMVVAISILLVALDIRLIGFFVVKVLVDAVILIPFLHYTQQMHLSKWIPILSLLYPFYIIFTTVGGIWGKFSWKE